MIRSILATLALVAALLTGQTLVSPAADATCSGGVCSTVKNADNSTQRIYVYCQNVGFKSSFYLNPGQEAGCGQYAYAFEVYQPASGVWCRPLGQNVAYTYWGGPNRYALNGTARWNCLVTG